MWITRKHKVSEKSSFVRANCIMSFYARIVNHKITDAAIVRIEQLYPFPQREVKRIVKKYSGAREIVWTQEEPRNQGAWYYMQSRRNLKSCVKENQQLCYAGRPYSASPAAGSLQVHRRQQQALILDALGISKQTSKKPSLRAV